MTRALARRQVPGVREQIHDVRDHRVILDSDLAWIYGVSTKAFNQAIRRNAKRFPRDFMFRLTRDEFKNLRSQFVTSSLDYGGRRYLPMAFTEHGALMAANVLRSPRAAQMSVAVVRAFVQLRQFALTHDELARRLGELEHKYDSQFQEVFDAIRALMEPEEDDRPRKRIGFQGELEG